MCKSEKKSFDFVTMEQDILTFWEKEECFQKLQEKNHGNKIFRFLDGPITANNPMGVHHAWGRTTKDIFLRYKAMNGYSSHYRNGFDSQGLWVEVEVEKELGFKSKRDIEQYGLENFTKKCIDRITKYSKIITGQSKRLGQWMDWDHSYYTHKDNNIEGIWFFLKKCHEKGWIARYDKPMPWCPRCGTSLSAHEMSGSYKQITHQSVFFRLPVAERDFDMLVWTTTPWTLSANVALAVNPDIDYCIVELESSERQLVLAKESLKVLKGQNKTVIKTIKGSELIDLEYETCFPNMPKQESIKHKIVPWEDVDAGEGTGIVHIAPGCGEEDYELGNKLDLPRIQPVDEQGIFMEGFDFLTGKAIKEITDLVFDKLADDNKLFRVMDYEHSYPVCWRCKTEVIYRLVKEWYIKCDDIRPKLIEAAKQVKWEPEHMEKRMLDWLTNMGDWNISRKRFYGLPLPFYVCDSCGELTVLASREELMHHASQEEELPELHRPWIDNVQINCPHCQAKVSRVPDVGDVWLDAGIVPYSTLGYFEDRDKWQKYFPAEWITEMREQIRLWFYSMLFMSVVLEERPPYEKVLAYNMVVAEDGTRFSKTGHMIQFDEAAEVIGSDGVRYLFAGAAVNNEVRFGFSLGAEAKRKLLNLYNVFTFFDMYATIDKPDISLDVKKLSTTNPMDKWLLAKTQSFIKTCTDAMEKYNTVSVLKNFEKFMDDVSNWYIRVNRRRFWKASGDESKLDAYKCLYYALKTTVQVMSPIVPFLSEYIWQHCMRKMEGNVMESVHLSKWPTVIETFENEEKLEEVEVVRNVINLVLRLRNEKQLKVRQPLRKIYLLDNERYMDTITKFEQIILDETNVKGIEIVADISTLQEEFLILNFKKAGSVLGKKLPKVKKVLDTADPMQMSEMVEAYNNNQKVDVECVSESLPADLFLKQSRPKEHLLTAGEGDLIVGLSTVIDDELRIEGYMRDIIRNFQVFRKELGYNLEQRIHICIVTDDGEINKAVFDYKDYIKQELLVDCVYDQPVKDMKRKEINVAGKHVIILSKKNTI